MSILLSSLFAGNVGGGGTATAGDVQTTLSRADNIWSINTSDLNVRGFSGSYGFPQNRYDSLGFIAKKSFTIPADGGLTAICKSDTIATTTSSTVSLLVNNTAVLNATWATPGQISAPSTPTFTTNKTGTISPTTSRSYVVTAVDATGETVGSSPLSANLSYDRFLMYPSYKSHEFGRVSGTTTAGASASSGSTIIVAAAGVDNTGNVTAFSGGIWFVFKSKYVYLSSVNGQLVSSANVSFSSITGGSLTIGQKIEACYAYFSSDGTHTDSSEVASYTITTNAVTISSPSRYARGYADVACTYNAEALPSAPPASRYSRVGKGGDFTITRIYFRIAGGDWRYIDDVGGSIVSASITVTGATSGTAGSPPSSPTATWNYNSNYWDASFRLLTTSNYYSNLAGFQIWGSTSDTNNLRKLAQFTKGQATVYYGSNSSSTLKTSITTPNADPIGAAGDYYASFTWGGAAGATGAHPGEQIYDLNSNRAVVLSWGSRPYATGYNVYYYTGGAYKKINTTTVTSTTFTDPGNLTAGTTVPSTNTTASYAATYQGVISTSGVPVTVNKGDYVSIWATPGAVSGATHKNWSIDLEVQNIK